MSEIFAQVLNCPDFGVLTISENGIQRWLHNRIKNQEIIDKLNSHSLIYPISHGARVTLSNTETEKLYFIDRGLRPLIVRFNKFSYIIMVHSFYN